MSISNSQYDAIMRKYEKKRENARHSMLEHKAEVYESIPEYKEIENRIADVAMSSALKMFDGDKKAISDMRDEIERLTARQAQLLKEHDFPEDYLNEKYECPDCRDTGYINNEKCHCLVKEIHNILYEQSNVEEILARENFDTLTYDYYDDSEIDEMKAIVEECKSFVNDFDDRYENILLLGNVGVGKTFLTNCMAKALMDGGHSVIYFTSIRLFDTLSQGVFHNGEGSDLNEILGDIYNCDLLIIDDLGTETVNTFVASRLFDILNERNLRQRSTIISTNLPFAAIKERYSERNFSRIYGNYKMIKPDIQDIRIKKRKQSRL